MPEPRKTKCPKCRQPLRLMIRKESFDKTIEVTCPKCGAKFQTFFPSNDVLKRISDAFSKAEWPE